jgi:lysophospholipase L1-like esterase
MIRVKGVIMTQYVFYQTEDRKTTGIHVEPSRYYESGGGFGFSYSCRRPELNTGFIPGPEVRKEIEVRQDRNGCYVDSKEAFIPLSFQADETQQGNYLMTITLYAEEEEKEVLLFVGRRQLVWRGSLKAREEWCQSFPVTITDFIPRGETERFQDGAVKVTVISRSVRLKKLDIKKWKRRTVYLAGDSTVTDQIAEYPYDPAKSYGGWGQMLPAFLNGAYAVSNHAHSGLTTESFRTEGHYKILMEYISEGDICLFQFGHNDQKLDHLSAAEGYRNNLIRYIGEIREIGAIPVLITPLARNSWLENGKIYNDLLKEYGKEVMQLSKNMAVPAVDLHEMSMEFIKEHGLYESGRWFYPSDFTHTNDYGAWKMAGYVWKGLVEAGVISPDEKKTPAWEPPKGDVWLSINKGEHL